MSEATNSSLAVIADMLRELGYRGAADEAHGIVATAAGGFTSTITVSPGSDIQLRLFVVGMDRRIPPGDLNAFNQRYRFAKTYLDDDDDIFLEADFFFDEGAENAKEKLGDIMRLWEHCISNFKDMVAPPAERAPGTSPA